MDELSTMVRVLHDRQSILECLTRYCRGVDRLDPELIRSAYHEDAIDDHGIFVGRRDDWVAWVIDFHGRMQHSTQHLIANHSCELNGDEAHAETYYIFAGVNQVGPRFTLTGGRYIDRLERRNGVWAIAARKCVVEWRGGDGETFMPREAQELYDLVGVRARDHSDLSYQRPAQIDPSRVGFRYDA